MELPVAPVLHVYEEAPLAVKLTWSFVQVLTERLRKTTAELSAGRAEQMSELAVESTEEDVNFEA